MCVCVCVCVCVVGCVGGGAMVAGVPVYAWCLPAHGVEGMEVLVCVHPEGNGALAQGLVREQSWRGGVSHRGGGGEALTHPFSMPEPSLPGPGRPRPFSREVLEEKSVQSMGLQRVGHN